MRARAIALSLAGLGVIACALPPSLARAQSNAAPAAIENPIGKIVSAKGTVNVEHANAVVVQASVGSQTKVGDLVYKGDTVSTGQDSAIGIAFSDGTAFNLSSNARMVLNEFVYDPKGTKNSTLFSLSKGTFTFIAGKVAKTGDMKIDTPVATMGIRGTTPHVEIRDDGTVAFSTLVEDKKAIEKGTAPTGPAKKQRQAKSAEPVSPAAAPAAPASASPSPPPSIESNTASRCNRIRRSTVRTTSMSRFAGAAEPHSSPSRRRLQSFASRVNLAALILLLSAAVAPAQTPRLKNILLCNSQDPSKSDAQIEGCSALIDAGDEKPETVAVAHNNRGNAYVTKGEYDLAIKDYDEALKLKQDYARALNNRGVAYKKKGDIDRALEDLDQSIKLNPMSAGTYANRAQIYETKREHGLAAADYDEAIRLSPSAQNAWNGRCWNRAILGQVEEALADCNEALRLEPDDAAALDSRGLAYLKKGQWAAAIADYNAALSRNPKLATALFGRGLAKLKSGDRNGGNADLIAAKAIAENIDAEFASYGVQ